MYWFADSKKNLSRSSKSISIKETLFKRISILTTFPEQSEQKIISLTYQQTWPYILEVIVSWLLSFPHVFCWASAVLCILATLEQSQEGGGLNHVCKIKQSTLLWIFTLRGNVFYAFNNSHSRKSLFNWKITYRRCFRKIKLQGLKDKKR